MIKNWELKIKENKSTLIINDWGVKSDDIIDLARHLVIKFHFDRLEILPREALPQLSVLTLLV